MNSYYQIKYDTMIFSDIRIGEIREKIHKLFKIIEPIQTITEAPDENINQIIEFYKLTHPESYPNHVKHYSEEDTLKNVKKFYDKLQDCRHKIEAVGYSLFIIKNEIKNFESINIEDIKNTPMISMCPKTEFKNDILIFETESFLFQVKSSLDILIQALKYLYTELDLHQKDKKTGLEYDSEEFKICKDSRSILLKLNEKGHKKLANFFENENNLWIQDLVDLRNIITHRSGLENFFCFMFFYETNTLEKPKMPSGEYVHEYCENIYNNLLKLYETIFKDFLLVELKDKIH